MAFTVNRIDHVVLNTPDVDATTDWYVRVLGMVLTSNRVVRLFVGGIRLEFLVAASGGTVDSLPSRLPLSTNKDNLGGRLR